MALKNLQDLCSGICDSLGVPAPNLAADPLGTVSFTLRIQDIDIDLIELAEGAPDVDSEGPRLQLAVSFGAVPPGHESALLPLLLESNFLMMGENAPAFARDPRTGDIALQCGIALADTDVDAVCRALVALSDAARKLKPALAEAASVPRSPNPAGRA
jgi:hypothetical protein